jgi:hypothetical protein
MRRQKINGKNIVPISPNMSDLELMKITNLRRKSAFWMKVSFISATIAFTVLITLIVTH